MASNTICLGQRQACAFRATRLEDDCTPAVGADNAVVTNGLVTLNADPDVEEGTTFEPKNACDDILWTATEDDRIKRYTGDFEFGLWDYELIELMTGASLLIADSTVAWSGKNAGITYPGPNSAASPGVALEIWVKTAGIGDVGQCGPESTNPPFVRYVFPYVRARVGGRTFSNEAAMFTGSIKIDPNPNWDMGPYGDWPITTGFADFPAEAYVQFWDEAANLPDTGCGYIVVPDAGSGS
jgi:hypothetical protein